MDVIYTYFASLGYEVIPEDTTNHGHIDLTIKTSKAIWLFEFKVMGVDKEKTVSPLAQLWNKGYAEKYRKDNLPIYEIGVVFDPESRNIVRWEVQSPEKMDR